MESIILDFGKHNGLSLKEVSETDPNYLVWLKKQPYTSNAIKEAIADPVINTDIMTFGRYKQKQTLDWVFENDPMYFNWLLSNKFVKENMKTLYSKVLELHNGCTLQN